MSGFDVVKQGGADNRLVTGEESHVCQVEEDEAYF
jgi:hypothetical protein